MSATLKASTALRLPGRIISSGICLGVARVEQPFSFISAPEKISALDVESELIKLRRAGDLVRTHLHDHIRGVHAPAQEDLDQIVGAHLLLLDDAELFGSIQEQIRERLISADRAVKDAFTTAASRLAASGDSYMRARAEDFKDICLIIRRALAQDTEAFEHRELGDDPTVMVVPHLRPSTVLRARRQRAMGFVTSSTAYTSHGAILLRTAGIPALGGVSLDESGIEDGTTLFVDAIRGELIVRPQDNDVTVADSATEAIALPSEYEVRPPLDAELKAGGSVRLYANIDHPSQAAQCLVHRLRGVGLFRTELLMSDDGVVPDEETQYRTISDLVDALTGRPLVIRTFDFGAEKELPGFYQCEGQNPALGLRGIRRHLHRSPDELKIQLRAILRAAANSDIAILIPMVTDAEDIRAVRSYLREVEEDLSQSRVPFNPEIRLGAMLEIPAAALGVSQILEVVDFLSVGTNDLVQYLAAADRENPAVVRYQDVERSGMYRILSLVMGMAYQAGREKDISVCGELASDPKGASELVRLGVRSLSVTPYAADSVREALRSLECQETD